MSFAIRAKSRQHGELVHRRKTAEAALTKAREMSRTGCYDVTITTPEGREYHSSEFSDLPRLRAAERPAVHGRAISRPSR